MNETKIIKTYYDSGLIESIEIKKGEKNELVVFNKNGKCTYSSSDDYEEETELKLHKDYFLKIF